MRYDYDKGGSFPPALSIVENKTGRDISVLTAETWAYVMRRYGQDERG